jgi:uncharacterized protein YjiS (DUF1127 family)
MSASLAHSPRPLTIGTPASSVLGMLLTVLAALSQRLRMRRDLHDLLSLDDAALHDIGLSRGGIEHAVRHGRRETPSRSASACRTGPRASVPPSSWTEWR